VANLLAPVAKAKFFDNNGRPAAGYKLFTYEAGTSTKLATYTDETTGTPNSNPVVMDFRGEANVWVPPNIAYKFVFAPPTDTDPPAAAIWTVDDIVDSQLVTLWGGVDTGIANAYVLNFTANFASYTDGIVIYWIPSNTNTGASTINVNGLGPVAITNQDGTALYLGQLQANQVALIIYKGTGFILIAFDPLPSINDEAGDYTFQIGDANNIVRGTSASDRTWTVPPNVDVGFPIGTAIELMSTGGGTISIAAGAGVTINAFAGIPLPLTLPANCTTVIRKTDINTWQQTTISYLSRRGSFTATLTGMTASTTGQIDYILTENTVWLSRSGSSSGISGTSNATTMTMTGLPADLRPKFDTRAVCFGVQDNSTGPLGAYTTISSAGVVTFQLAANPPAAFTAANSKGLFAGWKMTYPLF
jgi:hypothetical protein